MKKFALALCGLMLMDRLSTAAIIDFTTKRKSKSWYYDDNGNPESVGSLDFTGSLLAISTAERGDAQRLTRLFPFPIDETKKRARS